MLTTQIFLFVLWVCFWSFWSVLISRLKDKIDKETLKWIVYWRSMCPNCKKILGFSDLFPIFSYIFLKWKCRNCWKKISIFYIMLEIFMWTWFLLSLNFCINYLWYFNIYSLDFLKILIFFLIINFFLILYVFYDLYYFEINTYMWLVLFFFIVFSQFFWIIWDFKQCFFWILTFFLIFYFVYIFWRYYVYYRYKVSWYEWFWSWDVLVWMSIWALSHFILLSNWLEIYDIFIVWIVYLMICCFLWIFHAWINFVVYKWNYWKAIPFLPSMIVWYFLIFLFWWKIIQFLF